MDRSEETSGAFTARMKGKQPLAPKKRFSPPEHNVQ